MPFVKELLNYRSLSIVGLEKNTGKTVCLNYILGRMHQLGVHVGVTSIGVDGEQVDAVFATAKPEIVLYEGTHFVTSERHYLSRQLMSDIVAVDEKRTSLGRLVTAEVLVRGKVLLSGAATTRLLRSQIAQLQSLGAQVAVVDGALSRLSLASPTVTDAMILATGAAVSVSLQQLVGRTRFVHSLICLDEVDTSLRARLTGIESGLWAVDGDGQPHDLGITSAFLIGRAEGNIMRYGTTFFASGAVSDRLLRLLSAQARDITLIMRDLLILPKFSIESKLLINYKKTGKNSFESSFRSLSKQLQILYPHAYQSYIWNLTVSHRLKKYGRKLIIGDIVKKHESLYQEKNQEEDCDIPDEENDDKKKLEEKANNENKPEKIDKIFSDNFDYITEDNINKFNFDDLVMPMVGYEVYYPKNDIKDYIVELLKKDDLSFKDFEYQAINFNSTGYFRKVVEKPLNQLKYELVYHDEPDIDLQTPYYNVESHPNPKGNKYTSMRLIFQLPQSTYATMLFRELTKSSSSGSYQAGLSKVVKEAKDDKDD